MTVLGHEETEEQQPPASATRKTTRTFKQVALLPIQLLKSSTIRHKSSTQENKPSVSPRPFPGNGDRESDLVAKESSSSDIPTGLCIRDTTKTESSESGIMAGGVDVRVDSRFRVGRKIGSGSFGEIYLGTNLKTEEEVAIKFEHVKKRNPHLLYECKLYRLLAGGLGIPNIHWYGVQGGYTIMVMDLLGPSLEDLFNYCSRKFMLQTTALLAQQMVERISYVHSCGIIHRDIKPHNFLIGRQRTKNERTVFVIDFGLAKRFVDPRSGAHIPFRNNKSLTGTARYVSLNTHLGLEQSRRDDLESLGYVFVYFVKGQLPWQGLRATSKKDKYEMIMEKKHSTTLEALCKHLPLEFLVYLQYCRGLHFTDKPDYQYIIGLFKTLELREGIPGVDPVFDWNVVQQNRHANGQSQLASKTTNVNNESRATPAYPSPITDRAN